MQSDSIDIILSEGAEVKQLIVRNVEDAVVRALKVRAAQRGRSMEAEHREILRVTLLDSDSGPSFKRHLASMPNVGDDADFLTPRDLPRDVD
jgi:plasmid stability protein